MVFRKAYGAGCKVQLRLPDDLREFVLLGWSYKSPFAGTEMKPSDFHTMVGMVTYGCLAHTKKAIASVRMTAPKTFLQLVVGKPTDAETRTWCRRWNIPFVPHGSNVGFAAGINDLIDRRFANGHDYLVVIGNDVEAKPGAILALIDAAETTDADIIDATGEDEPLRLDREGRIIADIFNLTLIKRSAVDAIGYMDVNFWPCYFVDNDYLVRAHLAGLSVVRLSEARYSHVRSATLKEEHGEEHHERFRRNEQYFCEKWGGPPPDWRNTLPWGGKPHQLTNAIVLEPSLRIEGRAQEGAIVNYWSNL